MGGLILAVSIVGGGFFIWLLLLSIGQSMDRELLISKYDDLYSTYLMFRGDHHRLEMDLRGKIMETLTKVYSVENKSMKISKELFELTQLLNEKVDLAIELASSINSEDKEVVVKVSVQEIDGDIFSELLEKHLTTKK